MYVDALGEMAMEMQAGGMRPTFSSDREREEKRGTEDLGSVHLERPSLCMNRLKGIR